MPPNKPAKLALMLQVYSEDVWIGQRLARLICSIDKSRDDIDFIVSARRGTNPDAVRQLADIARKTFRNVQVINGKRYGVGWPLGCNDLWQEGMMRAEQLYKAGKITAKGILTFESDCIPLRPDWIDALEAEWAAVHKERKLCVGHAHSFQNKQNPAVMDPPTHINGNAIFHVNATSIFPELNGCPSGSGWDAWHGELLLKIGRDTNMIYQKYRIQEATRDQVEGLRKNGEIPALFHGIKKTDGLAAVEAMVEDGSFFTRL